MLKKDTLSFWKRNNICNSRFFLKELTVVSACRGCSSMDGLVVDGEGQVVITLTGVVSTDVSQLLYDL